MPKRIRAQYNKKLKETQKDLKKKIGMFDRLPDNCLTCNKEFDKMDIEQVSSWTVVVKNDTVRLYCPDCMKKAKGIIEDFYEKKGKEKQNESV